MNDARKKGLCVPAVIVHHKVYIDENNINDPKITLSWKNLEAICFECHNKEHIGSSKRYTVDAEGHVKII